MQTPRRAAVITLSCVLLLLPAVAVVTTAGAAAPGTAPSPAGERAASPYRATVRITEHGIPHVEADTYADMAYGAGWVTAAAATCTLMDTLLTARGQRSLRHGPDTVHRDNVGGTATNLEWDTLVTDLHDRQVVETLLADPVAGPSARAKAMVEAETAAINDWLTENEITDPGCAEEAWIQPDVTTTDVWYAFYLAQLISSTSRFLPQITGAAPPARGTKAPGPEHRPTRAAVREALTGGDFGSNATAVGGADTSTGRGMLLGNPHFPWLGRYRFTQMHLTVTGRFDAAGGALIGFPAINIGFNKDVAWSHTVSTGFRFTPYQYETADTPTSYQTAGGGSAELERRDVEVQVLGDEGPETVTRTLWRTPQGYVVDAPSLFMPWTGSSFWAFRDANAEHLRTFDTFLAMGGATSVRNLLRRQDRGGGMPWVNTVAADRAGDVLYADHAVTPHVTDELVARCLTPTGRVIFDLAGLPGLDGTRAAGRCKWGTDAGAQRGGILGPEHLPAVVRRDWVTNANDSYWTPNDEVRLTGYPRIIGCEECERSMRTRVVMAYVRDRLAEGRETPATLASHQYANRVYAAEVARAGGRLEEVCDATGLVEACQVLAAWDGRSDATSSAGATIFQVFALLAAQRGLDLWEVPFSAKKPLTTPRRLRTTPEVVEALADAAQRVLDKGFTLDQTYGEMHRSGDRGSAGWPLGGGLGDITGDANVAASTLDDPVFDPLTRGSSYIQSIAFRGKRRVHARTILTYSQYEDPTSPWSDDQTQMFSEERWVRMPWTATQIEEQLVEVIHLGGE